LKVNRFVFGYLIQEDGKVLKLKSPRRTQSHEEEVGSTRSCVRLCTDSIEVCQLDKAQKCVLKAVEIT
jgi:hypothetical protein